MPNKLFLRPEQTLSMTAPVFEWALYDLGGQKLKTGAGASLETIDQTLMQNGIENTDLTLLWPANAAYASKISLPGNQTRYIQQALPFAVEDQLAQDVEQVHIALGAKTKANEFPVISIDRALFSFYFDLLAEEMSSYHLKGIYLDSDLLPLAENTLALCISADSILVKNNQQQSIRLAPSNLLAYLDAIFLAPEDETEELRESCTIKVFVEGNTQDQAQMLLAQIEQYPRVELEKEIIGISGFELLCENSLQSRQQINLCQGEYRLVSESGNTWKKWRSVALIAGIGFLLQLGVFIGKGMYYEKQAHEAGLQALSEYKKIDPTAKRISVAQLPRILKGKLNQQNIHTVADVDFLTLLGEAGYQHQKITERSTLKFNSINYNKQRGELVMEMQAASFEQLEQLKQAIVSAGLTAKISSAVQEKGYFRGRISVSGA